MAKVYNFKAKIIKKYYYNPETCFGSFWFLTSNNIPYTKKTSDSEMFSGFISGITFDLDVGIEYFVEAKTKFNMKYKRNEYEILNIKSELPKDFETQKSFLKCITTDNRAENILRIYPHFVHDVISGKELDFSVVERMDEKAWKKILGKIAENFSFINILTKYSKYGVTISTIKKLSEKELNPFTLETKIETNPYIFSIIKGFGFKKTDDLALKIRPSLETSIERVIAFLQYFFKEIGEKNGHCWVTEKTLKNAVQDNIFCCMDIFLSFLQKEKMDSNFLYFYEDKVGLKKSYIKERMIFEKLNMIKNSQSKPFSLNIEEEIKIVEEEQGFNFTLEQLEVIKNAIKHNVVFICGKAGTGKTSIFKSLIHIYTKAKLSIVCCSLSAKASIRIKEATGYENSQTIHRLMKSVKDDDCFLPYDVIFIDECSMINIQIFNMLLSKIPNSARVILCGDNRQLPPIGIGNVFENLISKSSCFKVFTLTKVLRQAERSGILVDANTIREGLSPISQAQEKIISGELQDMAYMFRDDREKLFKIAIKNFFNGIKKYGMDNVQILVPRKKDCQNSVKEINIAIQDILFSNKDIPHFKCGEKDFFVGSKVVQKSNDYTRDVFNGEVGYVSEIINNQNQDICLKINFNGKEIGYTKEDLAKVDFAYAMTIHSAQGSGYDMVIAIIDNSHYTLLDSCMLYTMLTRAKKRCLLLAEPSAFRFCIKNNHTTKRQTWLSLDSIMQ